jgi:hypothetical protein
MATKTGLPTTREELVQTLIDRRNPQAKRADGGGKCTYLHSRNGGCIVGGAVSSATAIRMEGANGCGISQTIDNKTLPKRLVKLGEGFLVEVQYVHDDITNWWDFKIANIGSNGLVWNKRGVDEINKIINDYDLTMGTI